LAGAGGAIEDHDVVRFGLDDGDPLTLPVLPDADLAFAIVDAAGRSHHQHPWSGLAPARTRIAGADLAKSLVHIGRNLLTDALVGPLMVVMPTELVAQRLQFLDRSGRPVVGVEVLEGAVVPLQLAAGLWMGRPRAELADAHRGHALLEVLRLMAVTGDELRAVVADELARGAVFADGDLHGPPRRGGGEATCHGGADGEAGVVIEDVDDPGF
jgi:hypothetical protein